MLTTLVLLTALAGNDSSPIVGPTGGVPGDILVLDASKAKAKSYAWGVDRDLPDKRLSILPLPPDNSRCIVASVPGTYVVFCAFADEKGAVQQYRWVVSVSDRPAPPGPPNPQPPAPNPQPIPPAPQPLPDGRFKLAAFVADLAGKLPVDAKAKAALLAKEFRSLSAAIAAGSLSSWQVPIETVAAFNRAVGAQSAAWQPVSKAVQKQLRQLAKDGKIVGLPDLADAYAELAVGLEGTK